MVPFKLIIFDFDGCIVDSIPGLIQAYTKSLNKYSIELNDEEVLKCLSFKASEIFEQLALENSQIEELWNDNSKRASLLREKDEILSSQKPQVFPIIPQLLQQIKKDKILIALLTNRSLGSTLRSINDNELSEFFTEDMIVANDSPGGIKPKPYADGLEYLIQKAGITDKRSVVFIGDRESDFLAASSANVFFLIAKWTDYCFFKSLKGLLNIKTLLDCWTLGLISTTSPFLEELVTLIKQNQLSIFLGAGSSLDAGFDDWNTLVKSLLKYEASDIPIGSMPDLIQKYILNKKQVANAEIIDHLARVLSTTPRSTYRHKLLTQLNIKRFWTTNYDTLVEDALGSHAQLITEDDELTTPGERTQVIKINGSIGSKFASIVLSRQDFEKQIENRREILKEFQTELCSKSILFLGTSFSDPFMDKILSEYRNIIDRRPALPIHYTIQPKDASRQIRSVNEYGISEIPIPNWQNLDSILAELCWQNRKRVVVISGISEYSKVSKNMCNFLRILGEQLIRSGFYIRTGGGEVVSNEIIEGAKEACDKISPYYHRKAIVRYSRILEISDILDNSEKITSIGKIRLKRLLLPVGMTIFVGGSKEPEKYYDEMRREMFSNADLCIAIGGSSKDSIDNKNRGMKFEKALSDKLGIPYIPVPFIPGYAREQYDEQYRTDFEVFRNPRMKEILSALKECNEPNDASRVIIAAAIIGCLF